MREPQLNRRQAEWLLNQGWVNAPLLQQAAASLPKYPGMDLCGLLESRGFLSAERSAQARAQAQSALDTRADLGYAPPAPVLLRQGSHERPPSYEYASHEAPGLASHEAPGLASAEVMNSLERSQESSLPPGLTARYEVEGELSRGAMGVIYRARERESGQPIALKFMLDPKPSEMLLARFEREAETLIRLKHPNIINISDFGREHGHLFFAMELVEGEDLLALVASAQRDSEPIGWEEAARILEPIADALSYCHAEGVCHRDVKPANVLVEAQTGRPILLDFGLIKKESAEGDSSQGLTKTGELVGTPAFMAPEQFVPGEVYGDVGLGVDVWAWGATLFYLLTGLPPYNKATIVDIYTAMASGEAPPLKGLAPDTPDWLVELCLDCLTLDSRARPNIAEVRGRLLLGLDAEEPKVPWAKALAVTIIASVTLGALLALFSYQAPLEVLEFTAAQELVSTPEVLVRGRINREAMALTISGGLASVSAETDSEGRFEAQVPVAEGESELSLVGLPAAPLKVLRDTMNPKIHIFNDRDESQGAYILSELSELRGQVQDLTAHSLVYGGAVLNLDEEGLFELKLRPPGDAPWTVELVANDRTGRRQELAVKVETPEMKLALERDAQLLEAERQKAREAARAEEAAALERREKLAVWRGWAAEALAAMKEEVETQEALRPLMLFEDWQEASGAAQDRAIAQVAELQRLEFKHIDTRVFDCEGLKVRIGVFRHEVTGLELHLIPGGVRSFTFYANEAIRSVVTRLRLIASESCDRATLEEAFRNEPYDGFRKSIQEGFKLSNEGYRGLSHDERDQRRAELFTDHFWSRPEELKRLQAALARQADSFLETERSVREEVYLNPLLIGARELDVKTLKAHVTTGAIEHEVREAFERKRSVLEQPELTAMHLSGQLARAWTEAVGLRLPSIWEWRWACQGGRSGPWFWGPNPRALSSYVWSSQTSWGVQPHVEGTHPATAHDSYRNAFGLADTLGHAAEWCDWGVETAKQAWLRAGYSQDEVDMGANMFGGQNNQAFLAGGSIWQPSSRCTEDTVWLQPARDHWGRWGLRVAASITPDAPR